MRTYPRRKSLFFLKRNKEKGRDEKSFRDGQKCAFRFLRAKRPRGGTSGTARPSHRDRKHSLQFAGPSRPTANAGSAPGKRAPKFYGAPLTIRLAR